MRTASNKSLAKQLRRKAREYRDIAGMWQQKHAITVWNNRADILDDAANVLDRQRRAES